MLESLKKNETFNYQKLTPEEMKSRGILGRLIGPCADFINPTRNGRKYDEELWEKVFNDPIMQEKIKNKVLVGEFGHPADRTEIDPEKIAIALQEQPKKNEHGQLIACFDILNTPCGQILKTLCDYGSVVGVSSRGQGDIIEDDEGNEMVDPNTYECECWDVVLVPAVETARMQYVTEGLKKTLKQALREDLNKANDKDKQVMKNTLNELNIKVDDDKEEVVPEDEKSKEQVTEECNGENCADIKAEGKDSEENPDKEKEATNDGADELIKDLQETIKGKVELETKVQSLQEQLAVANDKVKRVNEELGKYKSALAKLSEKTNTNDSEKVSSLEEELKAKDKTIDNLKLRINSLVESKKADMLGAKSLTESVSKKDLEIKTLNENFDEIKTKYEGEIKSLNESIKTLKADSESKDKEYCNSLAKEKKLKESYKNVANSVVNRYIESKATALGVKSNEIKNKLPESYTIDDIDSICEELQSYALNISKLPFNIDRKVKVKVRESINETLNPDNGVDDDVDESLYRLAKLD